MKDEIKEILDKMKNYSGECHSILAYSLCGYKKKIHNDFRMCMNDVDKLLDYIINLKEKYDKSLTDLVQESHTRMELENKITNLQEIRKEHSIMKKFIYENGLWEKLLNDDRFLNHLRSDDNE